MHNFGRSLDILLVKSYLWHRAEVVIFVVTEWRKSG
jgi:hypothetical protein